MSLLMSSGILMVWC